MFALLTPGIVARVLALEVYEFEAALADALRLSGSDLANSINRD
jgi:hypothetical protein